MIIIKVLELKNINKHINIINKLNTYINRFIYRFINFIG